MLFKSVRPKWNGEHAFLHDGSFWGLRVSSFGHSRLACRWWQEDGERGNAQGPFEIVFVLPDFQPGLCQPIFTQGKLSGWVDSPAGAASLRQQTEGKHGLAVSFLEGRLPVAGWGWGARQGGLPLGEAIGLSSRGQVVAVTPGL